LSTETRENLVFAVDATISACIINELGEIDMSVVRYEPTHVLRRFQDEMNRFLNDDWAFAAGGNGDASRVATSEWTPAVDVKEEDDRYLITADIPGVDPADIEITMENGVLSIKGERSAASDEDRKGYRRIERSSGTFYRRFTLPDTADQEGVSARSNHGVLSVVIPKKAALQPRRIQVG
jgi:HSP20 family protein